MPFFQIIDEKIKYCLECWKGVEKDYRENSCDRYDKEWKVVHGIIIGYHNESKEHPISIKWNEEKNAWCRWGNKTQIVWQPSQEKKEPKPNPPAEKPINHPHKEKKPEPKPNPSKEEAEPNSPVDSKSKEDLCQKCSKNPRSGKVGNNNWNFCQACIKDANDRKSGFWFM